MKKGQSILEYIIILTAVTGMIIWAVSKGKDADGKDKGPLYGAVEQSIVGSANAIQKASGQLEEHFAK